MTLERVVLLFVGFVMGVASVGLFFLFAAWQDGWGELDENGYRK